MGVYYIYYKIKDKNNNEGVVVRSVNVYKKDTTPPVITINGKEVMAVEKDSSYEELGAEAMDTEEGDVSSRIVIIGTVNTKKTGSYSIKYLITDQEGNTASIVRVVNVIQSSLDKEEITLDLSKNTTDKIGLTGEQLGEITYTSNDESIVTVDHEGNVTGVGVGETVIKVMTSTGVEKEVKVKVRKTVTATYVKGDGLSSIERESDVCVVEDSNGCNVVLPTIMSSMGYDTGFFATSSTATNGFAAGESVTIRDDITYYARALDTTKPVWSLVSTNPSSGVMGSSDSLVITFKGTDTSGSVTSTLAVGNITVKSGSTTVSPATKTLSSASDVENGKQYTLTLSGISTEGVISITIAASTLKDGSNNENDLVTFTTGVSVEASAVNKLIAKSNPTTLTYANALTAQKKEMFTFKHTAGTQQSGWSASELTDYRYIGTSVNNYVNFNNEMWRIIGVFTVEDENGRKEQRMKIIRDQSIGTYSWDTTDSNGVNDWSTGTLQTVLNSGAYYNRTKGKCPAGYIGYTQDCDFTNNGLTEKSKNMIGMTKWYLGGSSAASATPSSFYRYERGTTVYSGRPTNWVGEVGLIYPSDYGYAASGIDCLTTRLDLYNTNCAKTIWLYNSTITEWTITHRSSLVRDVFDFTANGLLSKTNASVQLNLRPNVYLKPGVSITSGDGSSGNPYQLKVS